MTSSRCEWHVKNCQYFHKRAFYINNFLPSFFFSAISSAPASEYNLELFFAVIYSFCLFSFVDICVCLNDAYFTVRAHVHVKHVSLLAFIHKNTYERDNICSMATSSSSFDPAGPGVYCCSSICLPSLDFIFQTKQNYAFYQIEFNAFKHTSNAHYTRTA